MVVYFVTQRGGSSLDAIRVPSSGSAAQQVEAQLRRAIVTLALPPGTAFRKRRSRSATGFRASRCARR